MLNAGISSASELLCRSLRMSTRDEIPDTFWLSARTEVLNKVHQKKPNIVERFFVSIRVLCVGEDREGGRVLFCEEEINSPCWSVDLHRGQQQRGELCNLTIGLLNAGKLPHIILSWREKPSLPPWVDLIMRKYTPSHTHTERERERETGIVGAIFLRRRDNDKTQLCRKASKRMITDAHECDMKCCACSSMW